MCRFTFPRVTTNRDFELGIYGTTRSLSVRRDRDLRSSPGIHTLGLLFPSRVGGRTESPSVTRPSDVAPRPPGGASTTTLILPRSRDVVRTPEGPPHADSVPSVSVGPRVTGTDDTKR